MTNAEIKLKSTNTTSDYYREKLQARLAKLSGGVALCLYIGAAYEVEMKREKDRVDDALHATKHWYKKVLSLVVL